MQSPSKLFAASVSTAPAVSRLQGWADLPDGLLHSIFSLLGSFRDLLAFAATCQSWHAAFSSYPTKSTFCTIFPPLLIQPNIQVDAPHLPSNNGRGKLRTCKVIDPANRNTTLHCQIDEETLQKMHCVGPSYGHLIFIQHGYCLVVDPFSGAEVSPPRLPLSDNYEGIRYSEVPQDAWFYYSGILTAPLASPNSHLLVSTEDSLFDWPVGSDSWFEYRFAGATMHQIVEFKGQFIAMDIHQHIYTVELSPNLGLQEITTNWSGDFFGHIFKTSRLVVCGDKLLIVAHFLTYGTGGSSMICTLHHLDMSTKPAKWVAMEKLENCAVFLGDDMTNAPFSCMSPERWGGRSNCFYYARSSPPWSVHGMGSNPVPELHRRWSLKMQPLWVYPSMFYSDDQ